MSSKIAVIVCGSSGIDYMNYDHKIGVYRSTIFINAKEYEDYTDIKIDDFYTALNNSAKVKLEISTSTPGKFYDIYKKLEDDGYTDAIVITMPSSLISHHRKATIAALFLKKIKIHVFDSKSVLYPQAKMAILAYHLAEQGKSVYEILKRLHNIKLNSQIYFLSKNYKSLSKAGKINNKGRFFANLFKFKSKTILRLDSDGEIEIVKKTNNKKIFLSFIDKINQEIYKLHSEAFIMYSDNYELAKEIANDIKLKYKYIENILLYPITPLLGSMFGSGSLALGYINKIRSEFFEQDKTTN